MKLRLLLISVIVPLLCPHAGIAASLSDTSLNTIVVPASITFGNVHPKTDTGIALAVVVPDGLASGETVDVQSSSPNVLVQPFLTGKTSATTAQSRARHYRVSLSPKTHLGMLTAKLRIIETIVSKDGTRTAILATVPVTGNVVGRLTAEPAELDMHEARRGEVHQWQIAIKGNTPADLRFLQVKSPSPYLTAIGPPQPSIQLLHGPAARLPVPAKSTQPQKTHNEPVSVEPVYLTVTLSPDAPVGPFSGSVVISTSDGEDLTIPVRGTIVP